MLGRVSTLAIMAGLAFGAPALAAPNDKVAAAAKAVQPKVIAWRRDIHEHPELGNQEVRTAAIIAKELKALGWEVREGVGKTGVVGVLKGGKPGKVVALRADMDALPVEEKTGEPFASKVTATWEGKTVPVMHACGHDTHVAMLLGTATVLAGMKADIKGTVVLIFQPAEEGPQAGEEGGAKLMIRDGALDQPKVDAIFGLHIGPADAHVLNYRAGGFYAGADRLTITVKGKQTHGARPWAGVDMASVSADIIQAINQIAARQVDVGVSPSVVTIATINMGLRNNIIPEDLKMEGTMRTFTPERKSEPPQGLLDLGRRDREAEADEPPPSTGSKSTPASSRSPRRCRAAGPRRRPGCRRSDGRCRHRCRRPRPAGRSRPGPGPAGRPAAGRGWRGRRRRGRPARPAQSMATRPACWLSDGGVRNRLPMKARARWTGRPERPPSPAARRPC
jgi:amidohydrolase